MSDQFLSVVTDEAMSRICYDGGWNLKPWKFFISNTDILSGYSDSQIFDEAGAVRPEIFEYLRERTTQEMQNDYDNGNVWYNAKFSSISKASKTALTHHITIPGDIDVPSSQKIKTIYFLYQDTYGQEFLFAIARCNESLNFEIGITQSFFFNFTVINKDVQDTTTFVLNYTASQDIEDHNQLEAEQVHNFLVARDGTRTIYAPLEYATSQTFTKGTQLIDKEYLDIFAQSNKLDQLTTIVCPPGTLRWWPGKKAPTGWLERNGAELQIKDHPKLFEVLGTTYGGNGTTTFCVPDDRGLFIRGYQDGVSAAFGQQQNGGVPNVTGWVRGHNSADGTLFKRQGGPYWHGHRNNDNNQYDWSFDLSRKNPVYQDGLTEVRPNNRNYLPIIKDDYR